MKIGFSKDHGPNANQSARLVSGKFTVMLWLFVTYNFILAAILTSVFYSSASSVTRKRIIDKVLLSTGNIFGMSAKPANTSLVLFDSIAIELSPSDLRLVDSARQILRRGQYLSPDMKRDYMATITYRGTSFVSNLSISPSPEQIQGRGENYAYMIDLNQGEINGFRSFFMYPLNEESTGKWQISRLLALSEIRHQGFHFMRVNMNDENWAYFVIEQRNSGENQRNNVENAISKIKCDLKTTISIEFPKGEMDYMAVVHQDEILNRLKDFLEFKTSAAELFNLDKMASYFAVLDLLGATGNSSPYEFKFFFNPLDSLLEPVASDDLSISILQHHGLMGSERTIGVECVAQERSRAGSDDNFADLFFCNRTFFSKYTRALEELSAFGFLDTLLKRYQDTLIGGLAASSDFHALGLGRSNFILAENHEFMMNAMRPAKLIQAFYDKRKSSNGMLVLDISNIHNLPVDVLGVGTFDSIYLRPSSDQITQAHRKLTPVGADSHSFMIAGDTNWIDSIGRGLYVHASILGCKTVTKEEIIPYSTIAREHQLNDLLRQKSNIRNFSFIEVDEKKNRISFKEGIHQIDQNLIIPKGYQVVINRGTEIDLVQNANIISFSPLNFLGDQQDPIRFISSDSTGQGITVFNAQEGSSLKYTNFDNLSNPRQLDWELTSAITFYESPVTIDACTFANNRIGDDYLNVVRSKYSISNSTFINANADAFDGDFCQGIISNTEFINSGNDGIDISGSSLIIENIFMDKIGDKGISVGEGSELKAHNIRISNAEIAITSKDLSSITIDQVHIQDSKIAYTVFQKKPEFGPAFIEIIGPSTISGATDIKYLIEKGSSMTLLGEALTSSIGIDHVKEILYGVKYGKSSI